MGGSISGCFVTSTVSVTSASLFAAPVSVWARGSYPCVSAGVGPGASVAMAHASARTTLPPPERVESGVQVSGVASATCIDASCRFFFAADIWFGSSSVPLHEAFFPFAWFFSSLALVAIHLSGVGESTPIFQ